MFELRPYQRECLERLRQRYLEGKRRLLVSLPTGCGKTVIFARFPEFFKMRRRLLVLAHRLELLEQARDKFAAADPELAIGLERAGERAPPEARVVVASVPTLGRSGTRRLAALDPEEFYLVVVDEAHHAVAPSYRAIFDRLGLLDPASPRLLVGFTATPGRGDRRGLGEVFEEIAFSRTLEEMIAAGWLCRVAGWRVESGVSLDGVRVRAGDFVENQLARAVNVTARNDLILAAYRELAPGRRAIVFCVDVAHARAVAEVLAGAGIAAAAVWGAMPLGERRATLERFRSGELDVVTNCNVLTEGFDEPRVDCIVMARPTRSRLLYAQMIGRGTRLAPGKTDLLVIDVADNAREHTLAGLAALFDLPERFNLAGGDALETAGELREMSRRMPWLDLEAVLGPEDLRLAAEKIDLFRLEPPDEVSDSTSFAWLLAPGGIYRLALPERRRIEVRPTLLDRWEVVWFSPGEVEDGRKIHSVPSLEEAIRKADAFVRDQAPGAVRVLDRAAGWRSLPATVRQLEVLRSLGVPAPPGIDRGRASWMIAILLAHGSRG